MTTRGNSRSSLDRARFSGALDVDFDRLADRIKILKK
jgi:hypothetical protein